MRPPPELLTPEEAAALLRVKPSWLYERTRRRARRGFIPHHKIGGLLRFDRHELERWIEAQKVGAPLDERDSQASRGPILQGFARRAAPVVTQLSQEGRPNAG